MIKDVSLRTISVYCLVVAVGVTGLGQIPVAQSNDFILPAPNQRVALSASFSPAVLKGIKVDPKDPFHFKFFVYTANDSSSKADFSKLIKYFLASLTTPEQDLWVNLSPYEKNRMVPQEFGQTQMGRDLLAQDYLLKQITSSLMYPEEGLGKEFWQKMYVKAAEKYGTTQILVNTFNKVWIVPDKAVVYANKGVALVLENRLKVMLEEDYLAIENNHLQAGNGWNGQAIRKHSSTLGNEIIRELIIPALTKEVNEGKSFAPLRQVFYSLILAKWYKDKITESIFNKVYANRNKVSGIEPSMNDIQSIYDLYLKAFKKGVYNYIKEEADVVTGQVMPRKYFSGGVEAYQLSIEYRDRIAQNDVANTGDVVEIDGNMAMIASKKAATDQVMKDNSGQMPTDIDPNVNKAAADNAQAAVNVDSNLEKWGAWLEQAFHIHSKALRAEEGSEYFERILRHIEDAIPDSLAKQMVRNIGQTPIQWIGFSEILMKDQEITAQHVLMAVAFYFIWRSKRTPLTHHEKEHIEKLVGIYNQQSYVKIQLNAATVLAQALTPFFENEDAFQEVSGRFLETFRNFPDTDEFKITATATYLFLNALHHTALHTDSNIDIINDIRLINFLREQINSGQLDQSLKKSAQIAIIRALVFLVPWSHGDLKYTDIEGDRNSIKTLIEDLRQDQWVIDFLDEYYPSDVFINDIAWTDFSVFLLMGGFGSPRLEDTLANILRQQLPPLNILFLRPDDSRSLHQVRSIHIMLREILAQDVGQYTGVQLMEYTKKYLKTFRKGGIDLNPALMSMQVRKGQEDFVFDFKGSLLNASQIEGVRFNIDQIKPVSDLSLVLGLQFS